MFSSNGSLRGDESPLLITLNNSFTFWRRLKRTFTKRAGTYDNGTYRTCVKSLLKRNVRVTSAANGLILSMNPQHHPYVVYASSECSDESAHVR